MLSVHRLSLFTRLLAAFVLVVAVAFAVEAWLVIRLGERALERVALDDLSARANDRFLTVRQFFEDRSREVRSWSGLSIMDDVLVQDRVLNIENFVRERRLAQAAVYHAITVLDRSETVLASSDLSLLGSSLRVAKLAPNVDPGDATHWSDLRSGASHRPGAVDVAQPIVSRLSAEPIGWIVATIRGEAIEHVVTDTEGGSRDGASDPSFMLVGASGEVVAGGRPRANPLERPAIASDDLAVTHRSPPGTPAPLRGFGIVAAWSRRAPFAVSRIFVQMVIASTFLGVVLSAAVSFAIARYITKRLRGMIEGVTKVASGDLAFRVDEGPPDEFGELSHAFNVMGSELASARDGLEGALARWKALVTHAPDVILTVDRHGTILFVNRVVTGLQVDQVIGTSVDRYTPLQHAQALHACIDRVFLTGEPASLEVEGTGPGGTIAWYSSRLGPVMRDGAIVAVTIITSDISERKRLEKEVLEIAEAERARIGQDLHDGLGQSLTGVALLGVALEQQLAESAPSQARQARQMRRLTEEAIGHARILAKGLFPSALESEGLRGAMQELLTGVERAHGVRCRMKVTDDAVPTDRSHATHVFRIVQEAVNNALRHGKARHVAIVLSRDADGRILAIRDDGAGLPAGASPSSGMGLRSMRYRASVLGGTLELLSEPGRGVSVICRFR